MYIEQIRHKSVHKSSVPDSDTLYYYIIIVKAYLNVLFSCQICMFICMYVCMHVCTKSFLKTTTNSSCVCTHLANKADSDSDSDSDSDLQQPHRPAWVHWNCDCLHQKVHWWCDSHQDHHHTCKPETMDDSRGSWAAKDQRRSIQIRR